MRQLAGQTIAAGYLLSDDMAWEQYLIVLVVIWAMAHSYMDYKLMKRVEELEKKVAGKSS